MSYDRDFVLSLCMDFLDARTCTTLPRHQSDHNPLLLTLSKDLWSRPQPFQFQSNWASHRGFLDLVSSIWNISIDRNLMGEEVAKLKLVKAALKFWDKSTFGNVSQEIIEASLQL